MWRTRSEDRYSQLHAIACCVDHGCVYNEDWCPVVSRDVESHSGCDACSPCLNCEDRCTCKLRFNKDLVVIDLLYKQALVLESKEFLLPEVKDWLDKLRTESQAKSLIQQKLKQIEQLELSIKQLRKV